MGIYALGRRVEPARPETGRHRRRGRRRSRFVCALSGDGNTAIVGGWRDGAGTGAAWVDTGSSDVWGQEAKLVGTGAVGPLHPYGQGVSVSLSGDGNTAIVGGDGDNGSAGAAWVYTRSSSVWSQRGPKLVGTGAAGAADQGSSVALSP